MKEKICVFLGSHRPQGKRDSGEALIRSLISHDIRVGGIYVSPEDRLSGKKFRNVQVQSIPRLLRRPRKAIIESFDDEEISGEWYEWLQDFAMQEYSMGLVFFGSWLPPELFKTPAHGFINFHPGPLPALRGFEAETYAILSNMKYFYGTVHRVSAEYDEGEIIWTSPLVNIRKKETPQSLLDRTCYAGLSQVYKLIKMLHGDGIQGTTQNIMDGINASVKLMRTFSRVDWSADSLDMLDRKNRAFNGQYISVPLTIDFEGEERIITDVYCRHGRFGSGLGSYVGIYQGNRQSFRGNPMFQALDGMVVFKMLPAGSAKPDRATVYSGYQDTDAVFTS